MDFWHYFFSLYVRVSVITSDGVFCCHPKKKEEEIFFSVNEFYTGCFVGVYLVEFFFFLVVAFIFFRFIVQRENSDVLNLFFSFGLYFSHLVKVKVEK